MIYAINYSMAYPIYVLSKGTVQVEELCWQNLDSRVSAKLIQSVKTIPFSAILYRKCLAIDGRPGNIDWLNKEPQLTEFIDRIRAEGDALESTSVRDEAGTEFVLITDSPQHQPLP